MLIRKNSIEITVVQTDTFSGSRTIRVPMETGKPGRAGLCGEPLTLFAIFHAKLSKALQSLIVSLQYLLHHFGNPGNEGVHVDLFTYMILSSG